MDRNKVAQDNSVGKENNNLLMAIEFTYSFYRWLILFNSSHRLVGSPKLRWMGTFCLLLPSGFELYGIAISSW